MNTVKGLLRRITAMLILFTITMSQFAIIGETVVTYAIDLKNTNNENIEILAYFETKEGEKINEITSKIDETPALKVDVTVKNEQGYGGYFDGKIEYNGTEKSVHISAGDTKTFEYEVKYDTIVKDEKEVKISGKYVNSKKEYEIEGLSKVKINWLSKEDAEIKSDAQVITNYTYAVNSQSKKILQLQVKADVKDNSYPVKNTRIEIDIPQGVNKTEVYEAKIPVTDEKKQNVNYNIYSGKVIINAENLDEATSMKNDENIYIITFELNNNATIQKISGTSNIVLYDNKELKTNIEVNVNEQKDGATIANILPTEEVIYKGNLYSKTQREYTSKTRLNINYVSAVSSVNIEEKRPVYITSGNEEKQANVEYIETKINKARFLEIFGDNGYLNIQNQDGYMIANITKNTTADEDGNIVITYNAGTKSIKIYSSNPKANGILDITSKKVIKDELSREEVQKLSKIKEVVQLNNNNNEKTIELKEPETVATIKLENDTISTVSEKEQTLRIIAKLDTSDEKKELYKNPTLKIVLPKEIKGIEAKAKALYTNGLTFKSINIEKNKDEQFEINMVLSGEQISYDQNGGLEIYLELKVETDILTPSKQCTIKMTYTNEFKNSNKEVEIPVKFESQYGLMVYNEVSKFNQAGNTTNTISSEKINARLDINAEKRQAQIKTVLVNNYSEEVKDVKILSKTENTDNLKITLGENAQKSIDVIKPGEKIEIVTSVEIPENLTYNQKAEITQTVDYTYLNNKVTKSGKFEFKTEERLVKDDQNVIPEEVEIENGIIAKIETTSGGKKLTNKEEIYEGQTIKYTVTLTNNSGKDYNNIKTSAEQTNGTVWDLVEKEGFNPVYNQAVKEHFYEITDNTKIDLGVIENLPNGQSKTIEYEVVTKQIQNNTTYSTLKFAFENGQTKEVKTIENTIKQAEIQVTLTETDSRELELNENKYDVYMLNVKNLTNKKISNAKIRVALSSNLEANGDAEHFYSDYASLINFENTEKNSFGETIVTFTISEIAENTSIPVYIYAKMKTIASNDKIDIVRVFAEAQVNNNNYFSNNLARTYYKSRSDIEVSFDGYKNNEKISKDTILQNDEIVTFIVTIKNNENTDLNISISDYLQMGLDVQKCILVDNGETDITSKISNRTLSVIQNIKANSSIQIKIEAKINANYFSSETVTNKIEVTDYKYMNKYDSIVEFKVNKQNEQENQEEPTNAEDTENKEHIISGVAWLDENMDGRRDSSEQVLKGIEVRVINTENATILDTKTTTSEDGMYSISLNKGKYVILFMYDTEKYYATTYQLEGISKDVNSDIVTRTIKIDDKIEVVGATDELKLDSDITNINMGLIEKKSFDLKLEKFVEQIVVTNANGTKTYTQDNGTTLAQVEIPAKVLKDSNVVIVYKFKVTNIGDIEGYASNIVDYLPKALNFNSTLNPEWYQSGEYIYNSSLSNSVIKPGESKEIQLMVTRIMTNSNTELVENRAKIEDSKNILGIIDSTEDNARAEVLIGIRTGGSIGLVATTITIIIGIYGITHVINRKYFNRRIRF